MSENSTEQASSLEEESQTLGVQQERALELLVTGKSVAESAQSVGVSRGTVYRWLKHDPAFGAAYNQWREELHEGCHGRLLTLTEKATSAVEKALEKEDARTALQLLKGLGMIRERPPGPTDVEEVRQRAELERKNRQTALRRNENRWRSEEMWADLGR